jgi:hypothetical protein
MTDIAQAAIVAVVLATAATYWARLIKDHFRKPRRPPKQEEKKEEKPETMVKVCILTRNCHQHGEQRGVKMFECPEETLDDIVQDFLRQDFDDAPHDCTLH